MKRQFLLLILLALNALCCRAISIDQSVLDETFDSDALGVLTTAGGWSNVDPSSLKNSRKIEVLADLGNLMGNGTANQILFFQDIANDPVAYDVFFTANGLSTGKVLTVSFDFYEPSSVPGGLRMSVGDGNAAANPVNSVILADGAISPSGSYTLDTAHHLDVVFNETGGALDYDDPAGGSSTLTTGLMDIWVDQVRVAAGVSLGRAGSPAVQLSSLHFRNADSQQEIYLDNITVFTASAEVVEPPPPPMGELLLTNLMVAASTATVEWNQMTERYMLVASGTLAGMLTNGSSVASGISATNKATFSYDAATGFFQLITNIAAVTSITSPDLIATVKEQSTVLAPTNEVYDIEADSVVGLPLSGRSFNVDELTVFSNLKSLNLAGSGLSGLGSLASLTDLKWLNLSSNLFTSGSLPGLPTSIEALDLESNQLTDLSMIEPLVHLRWLDLENNQITDLSSIVSNAANGGLGDGDELWVRDNPLSASATNQIQTLQTNYKIKVVY